jgi:hypothetical protein
LDEITPEIPLAPAPPPSPPAPRLPFRLPAEYYASPERNPVLPRAVPYGCGITALVFLATLFVFGWLVSGERGGRAMAALFGMMQSEIDGQFTKDVPAADRKEFDAQFDRLRERIAKRQAKLARLQPFLEKLRNASMDEKITPEETKALIEGLHQVNQSQ